LSASQSLQQSPFDFIADAFRDDLVLIGGVLAEECAALYYGPDDNPPLEDQCNI